jgi:F0F1-type ATP synthase membrane subunit b/b'
MENPLSPNAYMHTEPNDEILVDFDSEMKKERDHLEIRLMEADAKSEARLAEMEAAFTQRCENMETKFMNAVSDAKKETDSMIQKYLGNMIAKADEINENLDRKLAHQSDAINDSISSKLAEHSNEILKQIAILLANPNGGNDNMPRKYQRTEKDGTPMDEDMKQSPNTPASPQQQSHNGKNARAGENN